MTPAQEEALYEFLEKSLAFELNEAVSFIRTIESNRGKNLAREVESFIDLRKLAFSEGAGRWITRRGFFEKLVFVISPTRLELLNGILIPGHRCVPFANTILLPHEYSFFWQDTAVSVTSTEGPPEEFYPYYSIFGEEYAPQYVARENSENEEAFNEDPYDEPVEVSIKTLDMRNIYRETAFVPGDRFIVNTIDWKQGSFKLEKVGKDEWSESELKEWFDAAEEGFEASFSKLGTASCTEEQVSYAYWYGSPRMRRVPSYSLEEYLYEKTNRIETAAYGIETRFWYAGREIPDRKDLDTSNARPDLTPVEEIFRRIKIPVSEYLIQSYVKDSLYREKGDVDLILTRLVPSSVEMDEEGSIFLSEYIKTVLDEYSEIYSLFTDKKTGPIRQRAGELHTAVIDLAARLSRGDIDSSWLPQHTFIILSQIQNHTASLMEDLDSGESFEDAEMQALDNSLDSMIETYEDVKELIDEALESFRRNKLAVIHLGDGTFSERLLQLSIGGTDVWRRVIVPDDITLGELHTVIQAVFGWQNSESYKFGIGEGSFSGELENETKVSSLEGENIVELLYQYEIKWNVRIMILSRQETPGLRSVRCVAGAGAAPPEFIAGPVKFRRLVASLESGNDMERLGARQELGADFMPGEFDKEVCNRLLSLTMQTRRRNN